MRKFLLLFCTILLLSPLAASAYGKRRIGGTTAMQRGSTTGTFIDKQVWLPGTWAVTQTPDSLTFRRTHSDRIHQSVVRLLRSPREQCGYGHVRIRALKAWGGSSLEQSQGRIEPISFGTSKYRGYTWMQPSTWKGDHYWCLAQDLKTALELSAPEGDTDLIKFIRNDLLLQLAVRSGRSVLPWPAASYHSSASSAY